MRFLALAFTLLLTAGCLERDPGDGPGTPVAPSPGGSPTSAPTQGADGPVALRALGGGQSASTRAEARFVFTQTGRFVDFWQDVRETADAAPAVDFSRATVVAVVSDALPNACWSMRVTNATASGGVTSVEVTTYRPPADMMCAQMIVYPWHVVELRGAERTVTFVEREVDGPPPEAEEEQG